MSNQKGANRHTDHKRGSTKPVTRRRIIIGGTTALGTLAAGSVVAAQTASQPTKKAAPNTTGKLNGRVAVITGAARGIGRACAVTLAREGADIVALDIAEPKALGDTLGYSLATSEDLRETERQVKALGRRCLIVPGDVRNIEQVRQAIKRGINELGKVDIMIANAGILPRMPLSEVTDQVWDDTIGINLTGVGNAIRAVAPHMIERKSANRRYCLSTRSLWRTPTARLYRE